MSKAIKKVDPNVQLGAGVHENDMEWNTKMLTKLAELDIEAIRFIEPHPFSFAWIKGRRKIDEYYARIAESEVLRPKIREKIKFINKVSHGNWRLDACAWNIHPPGWTPPYYVSTDMAVGIHVASMFGMFWEEGVHAAQFFQFASRKNKDSHFYIVKNTDKGLELMPSGEVFKLYGKYFRGNRLKVKVESPYFVYKKNIFKIKKEIEKDIKVPLIIAHAAYDLKNKQIVIIITNKHKISTGTVNINLTRFTPSCRKAELLKISAAKPVSMIPITEKKEITLPFGSDPNITVSCSPYSVNALIIKGDISSQEDKVLAGKRYIKNWTVENIQEVSKKQKSRIIPSMITRVIPPVLLTLLKFLK